MDLKFFNIVLSKEAYEKSEAMFRGLIRSLMEIGIHPMDVCEVDFVETDTNNPVYTALMLKCVEAIPGIMELFKKERNMTETIYEGLPTLL